MKRVALVCALAVLPVRLAAAGEAAPAAAPGSAPAPAVGESGPPHPDDFRRLRLEKAKDLKPYVVSDWEARLRSWEEKMFPQSIFLKGFHGIRPLIGGMPSGSGFVLGLGYIAGLDSEHLQVQVNGRYSTRSYTQVDALATFPTALARRPFGFTVAGAYQDYVAQRFFGLGNDSDKDDLSYFRETNELVVPGGWVRLHDRIRIDGAYTRLNVDLGPGEDEPSVDDVFPIDPATTPALGLEATDYDVYQAALTLDLTDRWDLPPAGIRLTFSGSRHDDRDSDLFDFRRFAVELSGEIPLGYRNRRLAFRARTSHSTADDGAFVPVHLMETLGGSKTIRGYSEYRFRDARNLLASVEYRWEVWTFVDFAFFFDAGKVFADEDDLDFSDMHKGYGFGVRIKTPAGIGFAVDLAGSDEGFKIHIGGGPRF